MPDLTFSSKGSEKVLADQQRLAEGAKAMTALYKQENRELAQLGRDASRAFDGTRTTLEKLQITANKLQAAVANTKLPDLERQKAAEALKRVNVQIKDIEENGGRASTKLNEAFGGAKTALLGTFATAAGAAAAAVAATIKVVTDELRAAQELADKASATQLSIGASRNVVIRNLPGAGNETIQKVLAQNASLAATTGVSESAVNQARASALSASGGNIGASLAATEIAARFLADRPSEIGDFAGTLLDLSKVTGTTDARVNLGLLSTVGGLSRVTKPREQATSIAPALIGARELGFSTSEAAALFSTITTASGDTTGQLSGTATISLAKQLEAFSPEQLQGLSTGQKLRALQADRQLADQFIAGLSIEAKAFGPVRALLTNSQSDAAKQFRANLLALPGTSGLRAEGQRSLDAFSVNPLESTAVKSRAIDSTLEQLELAATPALSQDQIARLQQILQRSGNSATIARLRTSLKKYADGDAVLSYDEAGELLRANILNLRAGTDPERANTSFGTVQIGPAQPATEAELRTADLLQKLLDELKRNTTATENSGGIVANGS